MIKKSWKSMKSSMIEQMIYRNAYFFSGFEIDSRICVSAMMFFIL